MVNKWCCTVCSFKVCHNTVASHIYSQSWIATHVHLSYQLFIFIHFVGDCTQCSLLCTVIGWESLLHLNGCGISGPFICTASLWGLTPHGISDCSCITTVALETRLCKRGAFSCELKLHPSAKLAKHWETNKIIESESKGGRGGEEGGVICRCRLNIPTVYWP